MEIVSWPCVLWLAVGSDGCHSIGPLDLVRSAVGLFVRFSFASNYSKSLEFLRNRIHHLKLRVGLLFVLLFVILTGYIVFKLFNCTEVRHSHTDTPAVVSAWIVGHLPTVDGWQTKGDRPSVHSIDLSDRRLA